MVLIKSILFTVAAASCVTAQSLQVKLGKHSTAIPKVCASDTVVFRFFPRAGTQFKESEKYIAQLTGEISIDASDHIVTRLVAWPVIATTEYADAQKERPPAVSLEMVRLKTGVWLPAATSINGVDYPNLFLKMMSR